MFADDYYTGEQTSQTNFENDVAQDFSSPLNQRINEMSEKYRRDAKRYDDFGYQMTRMDGGILRTYKKQTQPSLNELVEGDYWRAKEES